MRQFVIVPIVEGYGEVKAVPILINRWLKYRRFHRNVEVKIDGPVRASGAAALTAQHNENDDLGIEHYVEIAMLKRPDIVLILLDADEDCPRELGASLLKRAKASVPPHYPIGVVVANREYEAWFLAAFANPTFQANLASISLSPRRSSLVHGIHVETIADCKKHLSHYIQFDPQYEPTIHQADLTSILPMGVGMTRRSRSFRKLLEELDSLLKQARKLAN